MSSANAREIAYWNGPVGKVWAKEQEKRDNDHAPITQAVLALASARSGEHALDIGCGSGTTTMMLAESVGAMGTATGIDLSAPMLEVARGAPALASLAPISSKRMRPGPLSAHFAAPRLSSSA
jgi:cyclopropane fatty-acyl-phospholipid synthase-like methyltransferase